jgi:sugar phosphate isomerase/epimerase
MSVEMTRKEFLQTVATVAASAAIPSISACSAASKSKMTRGVTLYSYTGDFRMGTMTLEDCIADVADMGGEGIEILGESHVPDFPNPSDEWVKEWLGLMDRYHTKPSCYDSFVDTMLHKDRLLTLQEMLDMMERDFKLANRMGFKLIRPTLPLGGDNPNERYQARIGAAAEAAASYAGVIEKALPLADKYDLKIALEMHSPMLVKSQWMEALVGLIEKTKTKRLGFTLDMSLFTKRPARDREAQMLARGARQNILDYIRTAYEKQLGPEKTVAEVKNMGGNDVELQWASGPGIYHYSWNNPKDLLPVVQYLYHIHGKFWEMTEELKEYSIAYEEVIPVLIQGGCGACFSSEYEGPRELFAASKQLRRHHAMLRRLMAET